MNKCERCNRRKTTLKVRNNGIISYICKPCKEVLENKGNNIEILVVYEYHHDIPTGLMRRCITRKSRKFK
jgi:protein-arginine kinase activator protein McsA